MADDFAVRILADLLEAGMTRGQIARHLGVTTGAVSRWVAGTRHPDGYTTFRLARLHRNLTHASDGRAA